MARVLKKDRVAAVLLVVLPFVGLNLFPTNAPLVDRVGRGFPWKWEYDPGYRHWTSTGDPHGRWAGGVWEYDPAWQPEADTSDPRFKNRRSTFGPRHLWRFDGWALAGDLGVAIAILGLWLAWNELTQRAVGNRPDVHAGWPQFRRGE